MNLGNNEEAILCYNKAIQINPNYHQAYCNKGISLKNLGKDEEAVLCFN